MRIIAALLLVIMTLGLATESTSQDFAGGTVKYQQVAKYSFDTKKYPEYNDFLSSLPKEGKFDKEVVFTGDVALYQDEPNETKAPDKMQQIAFFISSFSKGPKPLIKKVYYDFKTKEKIRQMDFMMRSFVVTGKVENQPWKLTGEKIKILDYLCMSAEMQMEDVTVKAWFALEIPVPAGPDKYFGLPGLILAVELDGETTFMASKIDLTAPEEIKKPDDGSEYTQEEFDEVMEEKIKEFEETMGSGKFKFMMKRGR